MPRGENSAAAAAPSCSGSGEDDDMASDDREELCAGDTGGSGSGCCLAGAGAGVVPVAPALAPAGPEVFNEAPPPDWPVLPEMPPKARPPRSWDTLFQRRGAVGAGLCCCCCCCLCEAVVVVALSASREPPQKEKRKFWRLESLRRGEERDDGEGGGEMGAGKKSEAVMGRAG